MSTLLPILPPENLLDRPADGLSAAAQAAEEDKCRMRWSSEKLEEELVAVAKHEPMCLYLKTTNRRNLLCTTCPRTKGDGAFTLGVATQNTLKEIWKGSGYQVFRDGLLTSAPPPVFANSGLRWSL